MKKKICIILGIVIFTASMLFGVFLFLKNYYKDLFSANTWINDIYCTGKSIDDVNEVLVKNSTVPSINIQLMDGTVYSYELSEDEYSVSYIEALKVIKEEQREAISANDNFHIIEDGHYEFDQELIKKSVSNLDFISQCNAFDQLGVYISFSENEFVLHDNTKNIFDKDKAVNAIVEAIIHGEEMISMDSFYYDMAVTDEMLAAIDLYNKIEAFARISFEYDFGNDNEIIDKSVLVGFIAKDNNNNVLSDNNNNLIIDENAVRDFILSLCEKYDTFNVAREFNSYEQGIITIPGGTYGNKIDAGKEYEFLLTALKNTTEKVYRTPEYIEKALYQGKDDIGPDYVEIDMTSQTLYVFLDRELVFSTPVVTGNVSKDDATPEAVCYVAGKYRNRILKGEDYEQPVKYWVPIYMSKIGIHDASWRKKSEFKPETYLNHGSHGCINVQSSVMPDLYKLLFKGMPVIMHY